MKLLFRGIIAAMIIATVIFASPVSLAQSSKVIESNNGKEVTLFKKRKLKERLENACWEMYVACTALCELDLETGGSDGNDHNDCMADCRDKWNDCLD